MKPSSSSSSKAAAGGGAMGPAAGEAPITLPKAVATAAAVAGVAAAL